MFIDYLIYYFVYIYLKGENMSKNSFKNKFFKSFPIGYIIAKSNSYNRKLNLKAYSIIKNNDLFDEKFYLKNYPKVGNSNLDPLLHYLFFGFKEGKEAGFNFDGIYYLNKYSDAKEDYKHHDLNPLVHYAIFGLGTGRSPKLKENILDINNFKDNCDSILNLDSSKKKILFVIHEKIGFYGGTGFTNKDIVEEMGDDYEVFLLSSDSKHLDLWKKSNNCDMYDKIGQWSFTDYSDYCSGQEDYYNLVSKKSLYDPKLEKIYFNILSKLQIDLIHINHLIKHSYDLPKVARKLAIPYFLSLNDFYYICPSIHLIDKDSKYCNLACNLSGVDDYDNKPIGEFNYDCKGVNCKIYSKLNSNPKIETLEGFDLKEFIELWQNESLSILQGAEKVICPSESCLNIYKSVYGPNNLFNFFVISHGRDFDWKKQKNIKNSQDINFTVPNLKEKPVKILFPGHISQHKGSLLIKELKELDRKQGNNLDLCFLGTSIPSLSNYGKDYGRYDRNKFLDYVNEIKPSFIGIFSTCPETYSHTLTEAWFSGVPVIVTDLGALKERINKTGGGWTVNHNSSKEIYDKIIEIANDKNDYWEKIENIRKIRFKTKSEMIEEYKKIYSVID